MFDKKDIEIAAMTDLIAFCGRMGIKLKKEGKEYRCIDHDSLYISADEPYKWYRHSTREGGKAIDFCQKFLGMDFKTAVSTLSGENPVEKTSQTNAKVEKQKKTLSYTVADNQRRVIGYLTGKRKLDYSTVIEAIKNFGLRQDLRGNCFFPIFDTSGKLVGAELHGTGDVRFKGEISEQNGYGFTIKTSEKTQAICFFESAIDLLSFWELSQKKENFLLVSMGGLKFSVVKNYVRIYPQCQIVFCVDNDDKGRKFLENLKTDEELKKLKFKVAFPKKNSVKDWNELLQISKGSGKNVQL